MKVLFLFFYFYVTHISCHKSSDSSDLKASNLRVNSCENIKNGLKMLINSIFFRVDFLIFYLLHRRRRLKPVIVNVVYQIVGNDCLVVPS